MLPLVFQEQRHQWVLPLVFQTQQRHLQRPHRLRNRGLYCRGNRRRMTNVFINDFNFYCNWFMSFSLVGEICLDLVSCTFFLDMGLVIYRAREI